MKFDAQIFGKYTLVIVIINEDLLEFSFFGGAEA
jgi:hypothetical protein